MAGTIICYGDSNIYGYDPRSFVGERYARDVRWTGILEKKSGWVIQNHGVNGRCIPHDPSRIGFFLEQMEVWRREAPPVLLWIMLGTNDLLTEPGFTAEDAALRMEKFLDVIQEQPCIKNREIALRLIVPVPMEYGAWVDERIYLESRRLENAYQRLTLEREIDFTGTGDWRIPLLFDGVHFSEEGHRMFAEKMLLDVPGKVKGDFKDINEP